jgi:hypothetical protein
LFKQLLEVHPQKWVFREGWYGDQGGWELEFGPDFSSFLNLFIFKTWIRFLILKLLLLLWFSSSIVIL